MRFWRVGQRPTDFESEREQMVNRQLRRRGITDNRILNAFRAVPRELFVAADLAHVAYGDHPLPIAAGQTISQPYIVALMIEAAELKPGEKVLEVGVGSGYAAAVMSRIAGQVIGIERQHELVELARQRIRSLGFDNVDIIEGDGSRGCQSEAPFDAILASASGSHVPRSLPISLRLEGGSSCRWSSRDGRRNSSRSPRQPMGRYSSWTLAECVSFL